MSPLMDKVVTLSVRVEPEIDERIDRVASGRVDGLRVSKAQVVRAALELGLRQMEDMMKEEDLCQE